MSKTYKKKDSRIENLNINNLRIEQVQRYKCQGSIINDSNSKISK
jgi:hypothetical protein